MTQIIDADQHDDGADVRLGQNVAVETRQSAVAEARPLAVVQQAVTAEARIDDA
jgi:hypothetical protein